MFRVVTVFMLALAAALVAAGCSGSSGPAPIARYDLAGQIMAINPGTGEITVKHGDIEGLMPGMTMTFPVGRDSDVTDYVAGDLIRATLEVADGQGRLTNVVRTGNAPLPTNSNEVALAAGVLAEGDDVPDAALIDQSDTRRSLAEWRGTPTVFGFVYTNCPLPNYCPLIDRNFASLQRAISDDPRLAGRVKIVSISIDPARDSPAVLATHATGLGADPAVWTFLTGDPATVDRVAGRFGVGISRADGNDEISHNLRTTLVGADGRVRRIYPGNEWTIDELTADLRAAVTAE